jgi:lipopolysaccharide/colanic/teichoic acid biosynthesis glycosyltransferase
MIGSKLKRVVDLTAALFGLVLLAPVMAVAAAAIWLMMGPPVLFRQIRPGLGGRPFLMYKFRTMREEFQADSTPRPDAERLTRLGRFLRKTSLDELPQLWNVLRGELSLVGPRPLLLEYLPLYTPEQARRHQVKPGITGWAQVHGRNAIGWEQKFVLDTWYVDHWSLGLDFQILGLTVVKVFKREGISGVGAATMTPFMGTAGGRPCVRSGSLAQAVTPRS